MYLHTRSKGRIIYSMFLNPIETVGFENVSTMLDICRDELERGGFSDQAEALRGVEVLDRSGAEVALFTLRSLPKATDEVDVLKQYLGRVLTGIVSRAAA